MICKKCKTENEKGMTFCQNCGEPILSEFTPIGNTITGVGNLIFLLMIIVGIIEIIIGFLIGSDSSEIIGFIGFVIGALTMVFGYILRAFVYGYGVIVRYCERRDNK
ncbi:hypothetical protein FACS1894132_00100 [Clostridia bacterium]|nr:hypothetical protein FACS1894132_00100 [Clostridia bacterium]